MQNKGMDGKAANVASNPGGYYGRVVTNYTPPTGDANVEWKIFYADSSNIYLIADDYVHLNYIPTKTVNGTTYKPGTSSNVNNGYRVSLDTLEGAYTGSSNILNTNTTDSRVQKWISWANKYSTSTNDNIKSVAYLLDTSIWNPLYKNNTYADYAIGAPTIELFISSYNQMYPEDQLVWSLEGSNSEYGYSIGTSGTADSYRCIWNVDQLDALYINCDLNEIRMVDKSVWYVDCIANITIYRYFTNNKL